MIATRRRFSIAILAAAFAPVSAVSVERLSPDDPNAKAMGFTVDASKIDQSKFPAANGHTCSGCRAFVDVGHGWGACRLYGGRLVPSGGLCAGFKAKADHNGA